MSPDSTKNGCHEFRYNWWPLSWVAVNLAVVRIIQNRLYHLESGLEWKPQRSITVDDENTFGYSTYSKSSGNSNSSCPTAILSRSEGAALFTDRFSAPKSCFASSNESGRNSPA